MQIAHFSIWVRHQISKPQCSPNLVHLIGKDRCRSSRPLSIGNPRRNLVLIYSFGQVPSHIGMPNLQTTIETQHDVDGIVDQRDSKTKNKGKKANLSHVNLGGVLKGYNEEDNNVTFLGSQFTGNILFYENVDPAKVRRGNYENVLHFINNPYQIYLDCYMRGACSLSTLYWLKIPHNRLELWMVLETKLDSMKLLEKKLL
nr:hypothetical protein [Tanacetum cinerariifolium]